MTTVITKIIMAIIMKIVIQKITKNSSLYIVYLFILISAWFQWFSLISVSKILFTSSFFFLMMLIRRNAQNRNDKMKSLNN